MLITSGGISFKKKDGWRKNKLPKSGSGMPIEATTESEEKKEKRLTAIELECECVSGGEGRQG